MSAIPLVVAELDQHLAEVQAVRESLIKLAPLVSALAGAFTTGQVIAEAFAASAAAVAAGCETDIAAGSSPAPAAPEAPTLDPAPSQSDPTEDQAIHVRGKGVAPATFSGAVARTVRTMQRLDHPVRKQDLRTEGQLTSTQVDHSLTRLMQAGVVTGSGQTTSRRYALKPDLEVVWNGTLDRQGTTFSLVGGGSL